MNQVREHIHMSAATIACATDETKLLVKSVCARNSAEILFPWAPTCVSAP